MQDFRVTKEEEHWVGNTVNKRRAASQPIIYISKFARWCFQSNL